MKMLSELDKVIDEIGKDRGIDKEALIQALEEALVKAARNKYGYNLEIEAQYNEELGEIELFQFKDVVETITSPVKEILPEDAKRVDPDAEVGDEIGVKMDTSQFGRIAAQTAKQVIMQNIREVERENTYNEYKDKKGEMVTGYVHRFEKGSIIVMLGKHEAVLPGQEQIPGESFSLRDRIKGYVLDVKKITKGPQVLLSRTHPGFLLKLFELEVPEISDSVVKIHNVAREPGNRAKIAVESFESRVDPVGACVGNRGSRVQNIVQELHGERIDIIPWSDDPATFVCSALAPAEVSEIIVDDENHSMEIIVDDSQLSLAIGKKGQNVRLSAKITGWKIDIRSRSKYDESSKEHLNELIGIEGIDEAMAEKLINADILDLEAVHNAEVSELEAVLEIDKELAENIKEQAKLFLENNISSDEGAEQEEAAPEEENAPAEDETGEETTD
jgi:N utilization substance protein A